MNDDLLELDKLYCAWNIINNTYTTPINKKILKSIFKILKESTIITEFKENYDFNYKMSFFKTIDLIIIYQINKLYFIPNYYKGRVIIHSTEKINSNLLKRKGFEIIEQFEYTSVTKYRDIGFFLYSLEGPPWYLKNSDLTCQDFRILYENFQKNKYIMIAKYYTTVILEKKGK